LISTEVKRSSSSARRGGQRDAQPARRGLRGDLGEQPPILVQHPVMAGPHQQIHPRRPAGKVLVDVGLPVGDHRHLLRPATPRRSRLGAAQPARTLLLGEGAGLALHLLPALAAQHLAVQQAQNRPALRLNRQRRVHHDRALPAVVAHRAGILDRQNVQPGRARRGRHRRLGHHLRHAHLVVAQQPRDAHLSGAAAAEQAHRHPTLADFDQSPMQKGPPFFSRASPNPPRPYSIFPSTLGTEPPKGIRQHDSCPRKCVNAVGSRPG
jgi:hypothetical protein